MTTITNAENLRQCKTRCSLVLEQMLAFALRLNWVKEVETLTPNFKRLS